jgi:hypothetical protein
MRKQLVAGLFPLPPLGIRLWLTLLGLALGALNLAYLTEIWPHTSAAKTALLALEWLLLLAVLPQGLWWAWRWLRAYVGPVWLQVLSTAIFLSGACAVLALWLAILMGGIGAILFGLEKLSFS